MLIRFWPQTRLPTRSDPLCSPIAPKRRPKLRRALKMVVTVSGSKRPTCPSCTKPSRLCLCTRLRNPALENKVSVTILQHSLERNHPLNSARIAKIGLKNVTVATVSDVHFGARFDIRLLEPGGNGSDSAQVLEFEETQKPVFMQNDGLGSGNGIAVYLEMKPFLECQEERSSVSIDSSVECDDLSGMLTAKKDSVGTEDSSIEFLRMNSLVKETDLDTSMEASAFREGVADSRRFQEQPVITFSIDKYGSISSLSDVWMTETDIKELNLHSDLGKVLPSLPGVDALAKGFVVKKLQKRPLKVGIEMEECEEFELEVPPGTVLLFPSKEAFGADELRLSRIEVTNLIVLDGTWAKAKRMYHENPWLKLLPHLRLDLDKMSLYGEVRNQPKAGYLSTIESIVYAMKAIGDRCEELDDLLDVFESMVVDQRRCKDERLSKEALESKPV